MKSKIEPSQYNVQKDEKIMIGNYAMEWGKNTRKKKKEIQPEGGTSFAFNNV